MRKYPSSSVVTPPLAFTIWTVAPTKGAPESSSTLPTISPWVSAFRFGHNPQRIGIVRISFVSSSYIKAYPETIFLFCTNKLTNHWHRHLAILHRIVDGRGFVLQCTLQSNSVLLLCTIHGNSTCIVLRANA